MGVVCLHISCDFPLSSLFSKSYASMKGTSVNNWLFGPVPCRASIRSDSLVYSYKQLSSD